MNLGARGVDKMRILFLSQLLPYPPDAGAKVRSYYVLRWLAQKHQVTLLSFIRPDDKEENIKHLEQFCESVVTVPLRRSLLRDFRMLAVSTLLNKSFIISRDTVAEMQAAVKAVLENTRFDAVHADQLWMAQYALLTHKLQPSLKVILDEHNACFQIFERLSYREPNRLKRCLWKQEARKIKRYEVDVCQRFDRIVTVTDEDRITLETLTGRGDWLTIPICVDTQAEQVVKVAQAQKNVLILGTMYWPPNVEGVLWFGNEVWPILVEKVKGISLTIVGKNPPQDVRRLEDRYPNVRVTGYVPDLQPLLDNAGVFVVPLLSGGGMRVKIVDAWRWGLPIVSTGIGAEGIAYRDGENILIADNAQALADAISRVFIDSELARRLRENGRRWVEEQYEWSQVYAAWDVIYGT